VACLDLDLIKSLTRIRAPKAAPDMSPTCGMSTVMFAGLKRANAGSEIQWVWPQIRHPTPSGYAPTACS
jgi:hypothetical protein